MIYPQRYKVLCADSDAERLAEMRACFGAQNTEILTALDGEEAMRTLDLHGSEIRLAILNSLLPIVDGAVLAGRIAREWPLLPVMLLGVPLGDEVHLPPGRTTYLPCSSTVQEIKQAAMSRLGLPLGWEKEREAESDFFTALVVDDTPQVREVLHRFLTGIGVKVKEAGSGREMDVQLNEGLPDIIVLDVMLPDEDGLSILARLKTTPRTQDLPVVMVSGLGETDIIAEALDLGADDYLTKPICSKRLQARVRNCLQGLKLKRFEKASRDNLQQSNSELELKVKRQLEELQASHQGMIFALSKLAESRDPETGEHLERLQAYCAALCAGLKEKGYYRDLLTAEFISNLVAASPLHDIGKVGIADAILLKPGKLSESEFEEMKRHSEIGAATLEAVASQCGANPLIAMGIEIARHHHEKWNGRGYPLGLAGAEIPLSARLLALSDVYDALTSKRVYKEAFSHEKSRAIILEECGEHFDPKVVEAFLAVEERFRQIRETHVDNREPAFV